MRLQCIVTFAIFLFAAGAQAGKISLVGGMVINPANGKIIEDGVIIIDGGRIEAVGSRHMITIPSASKIIDCKGKFILPGYIESHIHFAQSGDLYTRPDIVDLTKIRSYPKEVAWIKSHFNDVFERYLRSGITAVVDVGGPFWTFKVRKEANATAKAPRVANAGPLISSVSRPQLDLGDPPIVKIDTPDQARAFIRKLAKQKPDLIKIWYLVDPLHGIATDPNPPLRAKFRPIVHAVIEEGHAHQLRVAVHAMELETARVAVEEGADILVHSVFDKEVDAAFVKLIKAKGVILCPTLTVLQRYSQTFTHTLNLTPEEKAWGNPEVIATLDVTKIPTKQRPERIKKALAHPKIELDRVKKYIDIGRKNLKALEDAGITIAAGSDDGNIGTIHGPALFSEFRLMREAGLTNMQILKSATANSAKLFGNAKMGAIEPGNFADLVILKSNPLEDIAHASDIDSVIKNGVLYPVENLLTHAIK